VLTQYYVLQLEMTNTDAHLSVASVEAVFNAVQLRIFTHSVDKSMVNI